MNILVSRLSSLGDTVCSLPVASALKATFPDCRITWVIHPRFASIVERCSAVDEVFQYEFKLGKWLRFDRDFDVAIDLQGLLKSSWPVFCAKSKLKVGYQWQREGSRLFSRRVLPDPTSIHVVDQYVDVARAVGAIADRANFALVPTTDDVLAVRRKLKENGLTGRFVVMNPTAAWTTKRWPIARFSDLIDDLAREGFPTVLIGGKTQSDLIACASVYEHCNHKPADLSGKTSVGELVALIRLSSAHVGGDTGSSHIAAAVDIPAVGLYSITLPSRSCPYGQIERCHFNREGLEKIDVADVMSSVLKAVA